MDVELRPVTEEEFPAWSKGIERAFHHHGRDEDLESWRSVTELDRTLAAFDGPDILGTAGAFSFEMAVPGGATLPVAGVTAVSVRSTHRRRGVLRQMMARQLADVAERGEPIAVLTASETTIYGRFGYGLATSYWGWKIDTAAATVAVPSTAGGTVRLIDKDEAQKAFPAIRARVWRRHPGEFDWSEARWGQWFRDPDHDRGGASALFFAVHETDAGEADGYVAWRAKPAWERGLPTTELLVDAVYGLDDEIETALWQHLLSVDLVRTVSAWGRPVDEPLRWRLADARRMQVASVGDHLWVRLLDIERAFSARELGADDRLVVEVADDFRSATAGRYAIEPGSCRRTDADADLHAHVRDLGAMYLGNVSATTLGRAGRVRGDLKRADRLLASSQTPWCATHF